MPGDLPYFKNLLIAHDQLVNAWGGGYADETISSRAWRMSKSGKRHWPRKLIDAIFFWDKDKTTGQGHCELSFISEREGRQLPPELR